MRRIHKNNEEGSAAVETALVLGVLLMLALGSFEWGMALRDWMSVTAGTREGARVGASAGDETNADCLILEAAAGSLQAIEDDQVISVSIFKTDTAGNRGNFNLYRPSQDTDDPASLVCGTWFQLSNSWPATSRDNDGSTRDWLGVEVEFDHDWMTGFLFWSGSICDRGTSVTDDCWKQDTVMHIEPDPTP
jgi:hypothetical protein